MKQSNIPKYFLFCLAPLLISACGKYPDVKGTDSPGHSESSRVLPVSNLTGAWEEYKPQFITGDFKKLEIEYEIKEKVVSIGAGYKYRALTFDGHFPAKTLVVEQGTIVRIKIKNSDSDPHSIHTHVIKYTPDNDGAGETQVPSGDTRYFFWEVTAETPPGFYPFHDHGGANEGAQIRGLVGIVNIVKPGETANPGFGILMHDLDPSYLFSESGATVGGGAGHGGGHGSGGAAAIVPPEHVFNGSVGISHDNEFKFKKGEKLRIGVVNLGTDIHTFHPHGNFWLEVNNSRQDNLEIMPGGFRTIELLGDAAGEWLYHCHVPGHPEGGMWSKYKVE
jgi:FtsP/CotA-like multicopper oxidase with cupredoxin domain